MSIYLSAYLNVNRATLSISRKYSIGMNVLMIKKGLDKHVSMCTSPLVFSSSLVFSNFSGPVQRKGPLAQIHDRFILCHGEKGDGECQSSPLKIFL